jgi:large subunit ribosomal protein L14
MIQVGSILKVCDKTGVSLVKCVKVYGPIKKKIANIGDVILVSVKHINPKKFKKMKLFKRKRFMKGTLHRALIIRSKINFKRSNNVYLKFNENSVVLVNKRTVPISNRIYGSVLIELCRK